MQHVAKGAPKILERCTLPLTSMRPVSLVVTDLAVIEPTNDGLVLLELAPGVTKEDVVAVTDAQLIISNDLKEMNIQGVHEWKM